MSNEAPITGMGANSILNPVSLNEFFNTHWEQQPLHIARVNDNPFATLISVDTIESLLTTNELFYPIVQLSQSGHSIPSVDYTDTNNKIVSTRMLDRYRRGSTIVMSHAHKLHSPLMNLCREVQRNFMMRCQANIYLSPPGKQGFNPHFDTHDVFILQISGKKTFNFYAGGADFPSSADRFNKDVHKVGEKTEEIALSAGYTLYIPRGFVHDAVADNAEPSLHVTVGVYPILMHELIGELLQLGIESDTELRRSVTHSLWHNTDDAAHEPTVKKLRKSLKQLITEEQLAAALSRLRDEFALDTIPHNRGVLSRAHLQTEPDASTTCLNHDAIFQHERAGDTLTIRGFGVVIDFNEPYASAMQWLMARPGASVGDVREITEEQKAALSIKLRDSGLARQAKS